MTLQLNSVLPSLQQQQLAEQLSAILAGGAGRLEIRIEKHQVRLIRQIQRKDSWERHNLNLLKPRSLPALLAEWQETFVDELAQVMGQGFGEIHVGIETGQITFIESAAEMRAWYPQASPCGPSA